MIPCGACGNQNPIQSRYCRQCGAKLVVDHAAVAQALLDDAVIARSERWLARGRSALSVGVFLLVCALVLRYVLVPQLPPADIPEVDAGSVLPDEAPRPAAKAPAR